MADSPYAALSRRQGANIFSLAVFLFINETENTALIQAGQTITVNPRRGGLDKEPWRNLDLTTLTGQTIEAQHVFDVYLGETLAPYTTLAPLKAVLPLKPRDRELPADSKGVGGIQSWEHWVRADARPLAEVVSRPVGAKTKRRPTKLDLVGAAGLLRQPVGAIGMAGGPGRPAGPGGVHQLRGTPTAALLQGNDDAIG